MEEKTYTIEQAHKFFGIEFNQLTWSLLGKENRSPDEDEKMINAAHASHFHWFYNGTKLNEQRGEWLISRVYCVLNIPERAMHHALRCKNITDNYPDEMEDFDIAYADEGLARAYACNSNTEECKKYYLSAKVKGENITDKETMDIFNGDIDSGPWFGIIK